RDTASAGADCVDVEHRHCHPVAAYPGVLAHLRDAVVDQRDVVARASHVDADYFVDVAQPADVRCGDDAAGRTRSHGRDAALTGQLGRDDPAVRLHDQ